MNRWCKKFNIMYSTQYNTFDRLPYSAYAIIRKSVIIKLYRGRRLFNFVFFESFSLIICKIWIWYEIQTTPLCANYISRISVLFRERERQKFGNKKKKYFFNLVSWNKIYLPSLLIEIYFPFYVNFAMLRRTW